MDSRKDDHDSLTEKRLRQHTERGSEYFKEQVDSYKAKLSKHHEELDKFLDHDLCQIPAHFISRIKVDFQVLYDKYDNLSKEYVNFLARHNYEESAYEQESHSAEKVKVCDKYKSFIDSIDRNLMAEKYNTSNDDDSKTHSSQHTTASQMISRQRAKAEAARVRLEYIKKSVAMQRSVSQLQSEMELLKAEEDKAIAEAELKGMRDEIYDTPEDVKPDVNKLTFTKDYITKQNKGPPVIDKTQPPINKPQLSATAPDFYPIGQYSSFPTVYGSNSLHELSAFLMKKELLLTRFVKFDDQPESFCVWKQSFHSLVSELHATPLEETDLLIKYLGPDSSKQAISIKSSNASQPHIGLQRIWSRLEERYGSPVLVESALKKRLFKFPKLSVNDNSKLYDLVDLLSEIQARMDDPQYANALCYFNSSTGMRPIIEKLPFNLQDKWTFRASSYNKSQNTIYPPFSFLVEFIGEMSRIRNDPGFSFSQRNYNSVHDSRQNDSRQKSQNNYATKSSGHPNINIKKTDTKLNHMTEGEDKCVLHGNKHSLNECKAFRNLTVSERKKLLRDYHVCFKCCSSTSHMYNDCKVDVKCDICGKSNHPTAMHMDTFYKNDKTLQKSDPAKEHGREETLVTKCTEICGNNFTGRSCAKSVLVRVYPCGNREQSMTLYALLDDQSNTTLAKSELFDYMNVPFSTVKPYSLTSCSGHTVMSGRRASGYIVEAFDGSSFLELPSIVECDRIPAERSEIATPEITKNHAHLDDVTIPDIDLKADVMLLIGRDLPEAHHVHDQRTGPRGSPFAQKTELGWVLVGNVCLHNQHPPNNLTVLKTFVTKDGRNTIFDGCDYALSLKEDDTHIFRREQNDNNVALSVEDKQFIDIMDRNFTRTDSGNWSAPLPFRNQRPRLPNNRNMALKRATMLQSSLRKNPLKREHFMTFMERIFDSGHAEVAPPISDDKECWYVPIFGIYHPKKKDKLRVVFDSSATYEGLSLNDVLMQGPDLLNSLIGVLLRFRREPIAVVADIQQMFFGFYVTQEHRDFLRFFWHRDNNIDNDIIEYRMCVHVFGNCPSPSVATYGLRKCVQDVHDEDVKEYVNKNFYVDDGVSSFPSVEQAVNVLKGAQNALSTGGNLRLHKIASNSEQLITKFPQSDLASSFDVFDFDKDDMPMHHSLGLGWELATDTFTYQASQEQKPFTKRGLLSVINSLFDPLGFLSPIVIQGKIIMRETVASVDDWDETLPPNLMKTWTLWSEQLVKLKDIHIPRCVLPVSFSGLSSKSIHIFCDASENAISACAYVQGITQLQNVHVGFVFGKSKVAPKSGHTIPRLELCAAVLAIEIGEMLSQELNISLQDFLYYSDSKVVLGYISNPRRRFYVYVANRVARIHNSSIPGQWSYIPTEDNPADIGTRGIPPESLVNSSWILGPEFLYRLLTLSDSSDSTSGYPLISPESDQEIRTVLKTEVNDTFLGTSRFKRFSTWNNLINALRTLIDFLRKTSCTSDDQTSNKHVEQLIIKEVQHEFYAKEISSLQQEKPISKTSSIVVLAPYLDHEDILRVGGRAKRANIGSSEKTPILIPGKSHVATLIVRYYHLKVFHQGRHITEGAVRDAGFWITGGKRLITSLIYRCVQCKRLRGKCAVQKMADLPQERVNPSPPFTFVGVDVFGPWNVSSRRTRGCNSNIKRWAVLFTCLYTRAVHIEIIEEMSSSSFINALRRFTAIRGKALEFRSDRGTNFVGAASELQIQAINVEEGSVQQYLQSSDTIWRFNSPHSSHFGGIWERMIRIARGILDGMLLENKYGRLTHEILITLMAEVTAIMNSRPLVPVSTDPNDPMILSPNMLLTSKP